jgi:transitional endoplasmic reticulum ATPase
MQTKELSLVAARHFVCRLSPGDTSARDFSLTPAQRLAEEKLIEGIGADGVDAIVLRGDSGFGKTTILERVQRHAGGAMVGVGQFADLLAERQPGAIEEAFRDAIEWALTTHDLVIVDDLHLINSIAEGYSYPRANLLDAILTAILAEARGRGRKLLFAVEDEIPAPLQRRAYSFEIESFTAEDYKSVCQSYLGPAIASRLDFKKIHDFAPALSAHHLRNSSVWLRRTNNLDTDTFIEYLKSQDMTSNVELEEVAEVDLRDLKGVDAVIHALEAKIALPFENRALAAELGLKPKRGVLLAGPPGTGKTTVGRALAHRLKSKFFMIDGTVVAGSCNFFHDLNRIFDRARRNAPSVIFIDDADVMFESENSSGLCRYLLTMLDGIEGASAERVCIIMTAMEPGNLPAAVLRSGRVELWLEMSLPDHAARSAILTAKLSNLSSAIGEVDIARIAYASRGLTGADLKAIIEDGKLMFAYDKENGMPLRRIEDYFLEAIGTVRANRARYSRRKALQSADARIGFNIST